ncbi:MAG: helix-turn-helix transcriptional regulator [Sphingobacteriales bacterium]|nr:helix-turn-helix transcriptional regulator [Sphingobacteriales bacterium]
MTTGFKRIPKFFKEEEACFLFLSKGAFRFRTPTRVLTFHEGDAMLSKCGNYFIEQLSANPHPPSGTLSALAGYFYPEMVKQFFQADLSIKHFQNNFDTQKVAIEPLLKACIDSISYLLDNPLLADDNLVTTKLKELLLLLSKTEQAGSIHDFISSLFTPATYDFNEIIQNNLFSDLSMEELARLTHSSLATFKRKFSALYHESPAKYILVKRLEKSSQLLQIKPKPVADIAYECGFENITHFNKAFKKHFGKTPTAFRLSQ